MIDTNANEQLLHTLDQKNTTTSINKQLFKIVLIFCGAVALGSLSGYFIQRAIPSKTISQSNLKIENGTKPKEQIGIKDKKTFKDQAEGLLKEGGIDGEGNFHLERPGGKSQNVYLTSSTVDLSKYVGKKVKVWGETFSSQKAGWLMDVGLVEIF